MATSLKVIKKLPIEETRIVTESMIIFNEAMIDLNHNKPTPEDKKMACMSIDEMINSLNRIKVALT